jgi:sugar fermentation stimulation protein A
MIFFEQPIVYGRLLMRYKRFFMDVELETKEIIVAHVPNTGSMKGLLEKHNRIMLSKSQDITRRTGFTIQAIEVGNTWIGVNTHLPNKLIINSLSHPLLSSLSMYQSVKREVPYGRNRRSRVDFYFYDSQNHESPLYLEVKNVTLKTGDHAQFPDTISTRAHKHIEDLLLVKKQGFKAHLLFIVQRSDCSFFSPAKEIDIDYARLLADAQRAGLEVRALCAHIDESGLCIRNELPCILG